MEINIVEETPKKIFLEVKGEGHSLLNSVKTALWSNKHVKVSTYNLDHPLVGIPRMLLETDGEIKPRKAIIEATEKLQTDLSKLRKDISKIK
ncbi:DNA-directed RNA polymerase subunit L [Candidatus Woesearchaeota archaeon]|nr:DNA-directed RNA polymerase subunit L [Candidatus Woesearchaeota archaeon]